mmetsp:Transcript_25168/g.60542  ORF Transcript_25168/g.60542 Transcript_25168/m.60542 type:complete len:240 (+) Transcript_25168:719-1438(+)
MPRWVTMKTIFLITTVEVTFKPYVNLVLGAAPATILPISMAKSGPYPSPATELKHVPTPPITGEPCPTSQARAQAPRPVPMPRTTKAPSPTSSILAMATKPAYVPEATRPVAISRSRSRTAATPMELANLPPIRPSSSYVFPPRRRLPRHRLSTLLPYRRRQDPRMPPRRRRLRPPARLRALDRLTPSLLPTRLPRYRRRRRADLHVPAAAPPPRRPSSAREGNSPKRHRPPWPPLRFR